MTNPSHAWVWSRLKTGWTAMPSAGRANFIAAAATLLHDSWTQSADLSALDPDALVFRTDDGPVRAFLPTPLPTLDRPMAQSSLLAWMARFQDRLAPAFTDRDRVRFLRDFLMPDGVDREARRFVARQISRIGEQWTRARAGAIYRGHLREPGSGVWLPDPTLSASDLAGALAALELNSETRVLKSGPRIRVLRARVFGEDVVVKRYEAGNFFQRLKYRWRASRARRAWAAARTLAELGIPTAEALGYLEQRDGRDVATSFIITRYLPDAPSFYRWLKINYRHQSENERRTLRADLLRAYLRLAQAGLYHADTKLPNLLVRHPEDPNRRTFYWIDLECLAAGVKPTRRQIVRNLVQMNGSLRYWVPESDRLAFLRALARTYPWVLNPQLIERVRKGTRRRLVREVRRHTPPDGRSGART